MSSSGTSVTVPAGRPADVVGAWALGAVPLPRALPPRERGAMLAAIGAGPGHVEHTSGRLWLAAPEDAFLVDGERVRAYVGFVAGGEPRKALAGMALPDGHFAMARADAEALELVRSLSAGEHWYFADHGTVLLFATTLRALVAARAPRVDPRVAREVLLCGHPLFGDGTVLRGIREVRPGHSLRIDRAVRRQRQAWPDAFEPDRGPVGEVARRFRAALAGAVDASVGRERPVVVALSGGIDSSAILAAAVEVVGADGVEAVSYEFDDPTHGVETHFARSVTRRLGVRRHHVFKVSLRRFLDGIPEVVWRAESGVYWPKAFLVPVTRHLAERGVTQHLTGFGIGSHLGYFQELGAALRVLPAPAALLAAWRAARFSGRGTLLQLARIHPGLEPPHARLYDLLLHHLERTGHLRDRRRYYPREMHALVGDPVEWDEYEPDLRALPLADRLARQAFEHCLACVDVTRCEKLSRELGVLRISPAHFASTLRFAFLPPSPLPPWGSAARGLRPGKLLLRHAYGDVLPEEVLFRKKSWGDAVASPAWRRKGRVMMLRALPDFPGSFSDLGPDHVEAVRYWEPRSILASGLSLAFFRELFERRAPSPAPPTWDDLIAGGRDVRSTAGAPFRLDQAEAGS